MQESVGNIKKVQELPQKVAAMIQTTKYRAMTCACKVQANKTWDLPPKFKITGKKFLLSSIDKEQTWKILIRFCAWIFGSYWDSKGKVNQDTIKAIPDLRIFL